MRRVAALFIVGMLLLFSCSAVTMFSGGVDAGTVPAADCTLPGDTQAVTAARAVLAAAHTGNPETPWDPQVALQVAGAESGFDPYAQNPGSTAAGLFQIMMSIWGDLLPGDAWSDPYANAIAAKVIYDRAGGWGPWQAYTNGAYQHWAAPAAAALAAAQPCTLPVGVTGYVNPLPDPRWQPARTDQGVDFAPPVPLPVYAVGDGVVTFSSMYSGWPGGAFLAYQLTGGSHAGLYVFVAEHLTGIAEAGTHVTAGQQIATALPGYPWIETGWAAPIGDLPAVPYNGLPDGTPTAGGLAFARFLNELGRTTLQDPGPGPDRP